MKKNLGDAFVDATMSDSVALLTGRAKRAKQEFLDERVSELEALLEAAKQEIRELSKAVPEEEWEFDVSRERESDRIKKVMARRIR